MRLMVKCFLVLLLLLTQLAFAAQAANLKKASNTTKAALLHLSATQFEEPLVATSATTPAEDTALLNALRAHTTDDQAINRFLTAYPKSGWAMALFTNLGLHHYHQGRFSKAIEAWEQAWQLGKPVVEPKAKALVDRALGELMRMHARIGHVDRLLALFAEMGDRAVTGSATEAVAGAREGLWLMQNQPSIAFLCGPKALKSLLFAQGATAEDVAFIDAYPSSSTGVALSEVAKLASQSKRPHQVIYRSVGQEIPVPSVVHWKVGHYAALVEEKNGFYHLQDPTFGRDLWVSRASIDSEASGYFLVPKSSLNNDWRAVQLAESAQIRGMGTTQGSTDQSTTPQDAKTKPPTCPIGMCGYNIHEMLVSLNLTDTPVGYAPPKGPAVYTTLTYNQREASQPANFSYFNVGQKWTLNWLAFIQDDPAVTGASVRRMVAGGGTVDYTGYNASTGAFASDRTDGSVLVLTSANPVRYERRLADGSVEVYARSNAVTTSPRLIFLSKLIDSAGNALTLNYDAKLRLTSITDAAGRNTTFSYGLVSQPLLITAITDPFRRSAKLTYDSNGRLSSMTDVVGLTSSFHYNASLLIDSMTTPYGTTSFAFGEAGNQRWLEITDPMGFKERVEYKQDVPSIPFSDAANLIPQGILNPFNAYLNSRNTFYWDKNAYQSGVADYTKARIRHWTHLVSNWGITANTIESIKYPLENRIWHNYPDQNSGIGTAATGSLDKPSRTARVLDDGSTQLTKTDYNALGNVTREVDALGREITYEYATNQIDVIRIKRKTSATAYDTLAEVTYNNQHLPLTYKDAAGQLTRYVYNPAGQLTSQTNALNQSTRYNYNAQGYLTSVVNDNNATVLTLSYSPEGNLASSTDAQGQKTQYSYDALNRLVTTRYPDSTTQTNTWDKLDIVAVKDRENRVTRYSYDANRHLERVTNPLSQVIDYVYYPNGTLKTLTDENAHVTTWNRDLQSRVTHKVYANNKQTLYDYEATTSRLKAITDAKGQSKQIAYDLNDQITAINYLNPAVPTPNVSVSYDPYFQRVTTMTYGTGTTQYQYQPIGQLGALNLAKEDGSYQNDTIAYQYDALGRVTTRTVDTTPETFSYDNLGRITQHNSVLGNFKRNYLAQTDYLMGQHSIPTTGKLSVGTDFIRDNVHDYSISQIQHSGDSRSYTFTRSLGNNQITAIKEQKTAGSGLKPETWGYNYDATDRLLAATRAGTSISFNYDPADNITQIKTPDHTSNFSVDIVNQLIAINTSTTNKKSDGKDNEDEDDDKTKNEREGNKAKPENKGKNNAKKQDNGKGKGKSQTTSTQTSYDDNGNLLKGTTFNNLQWDAENRLVKAEIIPNVEYYSFTYDGLNRRIGAKYTKQGITSESRYLWCGEQICQKRSATDAVTGRYFDEGEVVVSSGTKAYYARDHLGSVRDVLDVNTGTRLRSINYLPTGKIDASSGTFEPEFEFAGMQSFPYMASGGALLTHHRVYDPTLGRWLSRDPIEEEGGINLYSYVDGDPVNWNDPEGLSPKSDLIKLGITKFFDGCKWVIKKVWGTENKPDYSKIKNPPNVGPGKDFTPRQKREALEINKNANGGVVKSDQSGTILSQPQKSQKGVTPDPNEHQFDHIVSKNCGGTNCSSNIQILSRKENRIKSDN